MRGFAVVPIAVLVLCTTPAMLRAQEDFGSFQGNLIVKTLPDGRKLELTHPFSYIDPARKLWAVPAGTVVDGASIPQVFWSIIGGPFEDKYREASVIHDYYCEQKSDTWQNTHLLFYRGMRARGVDPLKAKMMYAAVYTFGPRWIEVNLEDPSKLISGQPILLERARDAIIQYVHEKNPSLAEINEMSAQLSQVESIEQLEKLLYEHADCTPILASTRYPEVKQTVILCGLSKSTKKRAALKNLATLIEQLRRLLRSQSLSFLPAIQNYIDAPDPGRWEEVKLWSRNVHGLIKAGLRSVLDVEDAQLQSMTPSLENVFGLLTKRETMIAPFLNGPPIKKIEMQRWSYDYRMLLLRLEEQLEPLERYLAEQTGVAVAPRGKEWWSR